jgi:hypothetical protein
MIETETKIQSAIWELVTTEVDYIHALQTVRDVSIYICRKRNLLAFFSSQPIDVPQPLLCKRVAVCVCVFFSVVIVWPAKKNVYCTQKRSASSGCKDKPRQQR